MKLIFVFTFFFLLSETANGGEIQGRVLNAQGAAISEAKVTVTNQRAGAIWQAVTEEDGSYSIPDLESGFYMVRVTAASEQGMLQREVSIGQAFGLVRVDFQFRQGPAPAASVAEERNPNIFVNRIDRNSLRTRLMIIRGADPLYFPEFLSEQNYFGAPFGAPLVKFEGIPSRPLAAQWRGSVFGQHQNSALNARSFFNVGPLRASRSSSYGLAVGGPVLFQKASMLLQFGQGFTSGLVNANIQAPLKSERTPLSPDPRVKALISNLLTAYPTEFPNLPNVSLRQLNSNAPHDVNSTNRLARVDLKPTEDTSFALRYSIDDYSEDPFQIVAGQNPQTDLRSQTAHASGTHAFSPETIGRFGFHFERGKTLLLPTHRFSELLASLDIPTVPDISIGGDLNGIGPGGKFPRRRIQNRFRLFADFSRTLGRHTLKAGWGTTRVQVNDLQSDNNRGTLNFSSDFGRSPVENFLLGTPSSFIIALGNLYRGFRNWEHLFFLQDQFRLFPTFSLSFGFRYELMTAPSEVNGLTDIGFPTDKNNIAPRFGFAWNPGRGKTTVRGAYGISYGMMLPATYQTTRFNPPSTQVVQVKAPPDILNPLRGATQEPGEGGRSALYRLSPDLVMPYSHQYTLGIEQTLPWASQVRVAYIGMRSFKLFSQGVFNRAQPVPGIPATTVTINERRPDPRYFDINMIESNNIAYYDAVQLSLEKRMTLGLAFRAVYTFGKNINTGSDFTTTADGDPIPFETGTPASEFGDRFSDGKGVSLFDTPHALSIRYSYSLPFGAKSIGWKSALFRGWQISGTTIFQSGTPFHPHTGSDAPGFGNVDGNANDRPNILNPAILGKSLDDPDKAPWILGVASCKRTPTVPSFIQCDNFDTNIDPGDRGNIGWNTFRKDGTNNWNFAVGKIFRFPGRREGSLQFRAEFFNFLNHAQFQKPGIVVAAATFGKITNTVNKGRQAQFSLRFNF